MGLIMTILERFIQILIALDQLLNTLIGLFLGDGWADESVSAKAYRLREKGWGKAYRFINKIFFWQDNHSKSSYISEDEQRQLPPEYRNNKQ